jgi:hypothetical protein
VCVSVPPHVVSEIDLFLFSLVLESTHKSACKLEFCFERSIMSPVLHQDQIKL